MSTPHTYYACTLSKEDDVLSLSPSVAVPGGVLVPRGSTPCGVLVLLCSKVLAVSRDVYAVE